MRKKRTPMPMPVNLNDCMLLYQMGYYIVTRQGRVTAVIKKKKAA